MGIGLDQDSWFVGWAHLEPPLCAWNPVWLKLNAKVFAVIIVRGLAVRLGSNNSGCLPRTCSHYSHSLQYITHMPR